MAEHRVGPDQRQIDEIDAAPAQSAPAALEPALAPGPCLDQDIAVLRDRRAHQTHHLEAEAPPPFQGPEHHQASGLAPDDETEAIVLREIMVAPMPEEGVALEELVRLSGPGEKGIPFRSQRQEGVAARQDLDRGASIRPPLGRGPSLRIRVR